MKTVPLSRETGAVAATLEASRIAYLALQAPREGTAAYTHVHEIIHGFRAQGIRVDLYAPSYSTGGVKPGAFGRCVAYVKVQCSLFLRWRRYDVVYVRSHFGALPVAVLAWLTGKAVVHEVNGPYADAMINNPGLRALSTVLVTTQRWQLCHATGLVTVTQGLKQWLAQQAPGVPCAVVPNGANTEHFSPQREAWPGLGERYVVFFGGLSPWHGVDWMLEAVDSAHWPDDVSLVIVGDGPRSAAVRAAQELGKPIKFLGRLPYADVGRVVAHARASLVPIVDAACRSGTGLAPIKLFESAACAVPVVISDLPGQAQFVRQHGLGSVIAVGNVPSLAQAVAGYCSGPCVEPGFRTRTRQLAVAEFSWQARADQTVEFLRGLAR